MTRNCWNFTVEKKLFFDHEWRIKKYNIFIPKSPWRTSKLLQEKPSDLKREHPALQNMKFINFSTFAGHACNACCPLAPDPDPDPEDHNQWGYMRIRIQNTGRSIMKDWSKAVKAVDDLPEELLFWFAHVHSDIIWQDSAKLPSHRSEISTKFILIPSGSKEDTSTNLSLLVESYL